MKKKKPKLGTCTCGRRVYRAEEILAWLNGRLVDSLTVTHHGQQHVVWSLREALEDGLTVEDAVLRFVKRHKIDLGTEIDPWLGLGKQEPRQGQDWREEKKP